eukprot:2907921-Prymnesium_polylepis.1
MEPAILGWEPAILGRPHLVEHAVHAHRASDRLDPNRPAPLGAVAPPLGVHPLQRLQPDEAAPAGAVPAVVAAQLGTHATGRLQPERGRVALGPHLAPARLGAVGVFGGHAGGAAVGDGRLEA